MEQRFVTRQEICTMLGGASDRKARAYIEDLNTKLIQYGKCIVSTSLKAGYHIPDPDKPEDMTVVDAAIAELKAKAVSLFERRQVLEEFKKKALEPKTKNPQYVQLSIFDP